MLEKEVRKLYNKRKVIHCDTSLNRFMDGKIDYINIFIHNNWIRYSPSNNRQRMKAMHHQNYKVRKTKWITPNY